MIYQPIYLFIYIRTFVLAIFKDDYKLLIFFNKVMKKQKIYGDDLIPKIKKGEKSPSN
jgi:hypothetical protein